MALTTVTVEVETTARSIIMVGLDGVPVRDEQGVFEIAPNEEHVLFWQITGNPGTEYKITVTAQGGTLLMRGPNPIELAISGDAFMSGGHQSFSVKPIA
ncbi:MAG TPA: hypothetical protein VK610_08410 [Rhodothermales bacterium]|nr:hypothetical protein [Rhodothermales bacterium]